MLTMRGCSGSLMDLLRLMLPDRGHIAGPQLQLVQHQGDRGLRVVVVPSNQLKLLLHGRAPNNVEKLHLHELGESCLVAVEQSLPDPVSTLYCKSLQLLLAHAISSLRVPLTN